MLKVGAGSKFDADSHGVLSRVLASRLIALGSTAPPSSPILAPAPETRTIGPSPDSYFVVESPRSSWLAGQRRSSGIANVLSPRVPSDFSARSLRLLICLLIGTIRAGLALWMSFVHTQGLSKRIIQWVSRRDFPSISRNPIAGTVKLTGIHSFSAPNQFEPTRQISDLGGMSISGTSRKSVNLTVPSPVLIRTLGSRRNGCSRCVMAALTSASGCERTRTTRTRIRRILPTRDQVRSGETCFCALRRNRAFQAVLDFGLFVKWWMPAEVGDRRRQLGVLLLQNFDSGARQRLWRPL